MLVFPRQSWMDEPACDTSLVDVWHPQGRQCPHGQLLPPGQAAHDTHCAPLVDYRGRTCGAVFNLFTNTMWRKSRDSGATSVVIWRGIAQGVPTAHLADDLGVARAHGRALRHTMPQVIAARVPPSGAAGRWGRGGCNVPERGGKRAATR